MLGLGYSNYSRLAEDAGPGRLFLVHEPCHSSVLTAYLLRFPPARATRPLCYTAPCTSSHNDRAPTCLKRAGLPFCKSNAGHAYSTTDAHANHHPSGLVVGTVFLTSTVPSTFAFDKPIYSAIVCLTTLAAVLLALGRLLPKGDTSTHKGQYTAVPLEEAHANAGSRTHSPRRTGHAAHPNGLRKLRISFIILVLAICARVELAREILLNVQCTRASWEPLVPVALVAWDCFALRRKRRHDVEVDEQTSTLYEIWECRIMNNPYRYVVAVALACFGSLGATRAVGSPPSTHICATSLPYSWSVPWAQHAGTLLDMVILFCLNGLLYSNDDRASRAPSTRFSAVGWVCLVSGEPIVPQSSLLTSGSSQPRSFRPPSGYTTPLQMWMIDGRCSRSPTSYSGAPRDSMSLFV